MFCRLAFPLACRLPSTTSAGVGRLPFRAAGFAWLSPAFPPSCPFSSAMARCFFLLALCSAASSVLRSSQTPCPVHRWLQSLDFPSRSAAPSATDGVQGLPVLAHGASTHARGLSSTAPGPAVPRPCWCGRCCLRLRTRPRHLGVSRFRGSIPGLRVPLSTLRASPRGHVRMTRGHCGWLALQSTASSSATPCRFIPALRPDRVGVSSRSHPSGGDAPAREGR